MRMLLGTWLAEHPVDPDSKVLFEESMTCFAAGAYRASLVFSYLGLLRTIAHRISVAVAPKDYPSAKWDALQKKVREENLWEGATFDSLQDKTPHSIFAIDDDLRNQLLYWRGRRNDAAHWRGTEISAAHIEALWLFISSHLPKLVVNGGFDSLILSLQRHFDARYTPPNRDLNPLLLQALHAIRPTDYALFMSRALDIVLKATREWSPSFGEQHEGDFVDQLVTVVLDLNQPHFTAALKSSLAADEKILISVLLEHPRLILHYADEPVLVRSLWYELLPFAWSSHNFRQDEAEASLRLFLSMLANKIIPKDEHQEALQRVVGKLDDGEPRASLPDELANALDAFGFFEVVYQYAFGERKDRDWLINNLELVCSYLERHRIDSKSASVLLSLFPPVDDGDYDDIFRIEFLGPDDFSSLRWFFARHPRKYEEVLEAGHRDRLHTAVFEKTMAPVDRRD